MSTQIIKLLLITLILNYSKNQLIKKFPKHKKLITIIFIILGLLHLILEVSILTGIL